MLSEKTTFIPPLSAITYEDFNAMKKITKKSIDKIKNMLINQKTELQNKAYVSDIDLDGDETDEIQGKILANINRKLSSRDQEKIRRIDLALEKIEENTFGICEECGDAILDKRLEANPYCITCISCAEKLEMMKRRGMVL